MSKSRTSATKPLRYFVFRTLGIIFSVIPPMLCTLLYFPIYAEASAEKLLSLGTLTLLLIAFLPLTRIVAARLKSPSATLIWLAIFLLFYLLGRIAAEMTVVSFFGFIGNLIGSVFFALSKKRVSADE